jgi:hypothetical protein
VPDVPNVAKRVNRNQHLPRIAESVDSAETTRTVLIAARTLRRLERDLEADPHIADAVLTVAEPEVGDAGGVQ